METHALTAQGHESMNRTRSSLAVCSVVVVMFLGRNVTARVARIEILERKPFAGGMAFGPVGQYELLRGRLHYAVEPNHPRNSAVVDLHFAHSGRLRADLSTIVEGRLVEVLGEDPRNGSGDVVFSGDFFLLKPVDLSRGNHRLLYEVNNRGNILMLSYFNNAESSNRPNTAEHAGNGWLMRQGYSLLWSAWNWDVEKVGRQPLRINLPVIVSANGGPMTATINAELAVQSEDGVLVERIAWGDSRCYPVATATREKAVLTVRSGPDSKRRLIDRGDWQFAIITPHGTPRFDPVHVYLPGGFEKGKLYELIYTAQHPRVVGLGLTAVRDAISFFRFEAADDSGNANPLLLNGKPDSKSAYIFGISQSGRFITHMIYQGFHVDEQNRMVFEGARPHVAGGGKGGFNYRFAQTTHHPKHLQGNYFPADHFPFHYKPDGHVQHDPFGQAGRLEGDLFAEAKRLGKIPKLLVVNHEGEYWTRSASMVHTEVDGMRDAQLHPLVRVYMVNGVRHGTPSRNGRRTTRTSEHLLNQLDPRPIGRALLVALDEWVSRSIDPPASRVPRIDRRELLSASEHRDRFPAIPGYQFGSLYFPGLRHPGINLRPPRVDYGPRFWTQGVQDYVPPKTYGPRFETLVPAFDSDGNPVGGIRLPQLSVPLGTNQGFNPRRETAGAPDHLKAFESSFWPFAQTRDERIRNGDVRLSIEERYVDKEDYVGKMTKAARLLADEGFLLKEDETEIIEFAQSLAWPPQPTDRSPFWQTDPR